MGRRRQNGIKNLNDMARGAPSENRAQIANIINQYESGHIKNIRTAESVIERLTSKTKRADYVAKTKKLYDVVSTHGNARKLYDKIVGKPVVEPKGRKLKNIMVTMILFKEKDPDPKGEKRKAAEQIPVNIDFDEGTTEKQALNIKQKIRAAGVKVAEAAADEVVKTGRGKNTKTEIKPSKLKRIKDLRQFYIGQF